jgi:outer membrane protein OmpA-like peptidoglycan-associated protein
VTHRQGEPRGFIISEFTDDDARPDQEESELLFGEAIEWFGPDGARERVHPFHAPAPDSEPEVEPEPDPELVDVQPQSGDGEHEGTAVAAAAAAAAASAGAGVRGSGAAERDEDESSETALPRSEARTAARRRRNLLIALGALLVVLVIVAVVALSGGGSDDSTDVAGGKNARRTTQPAASTASTTPGTTSGQTVTPKGTSVTVNADVLFDFGSSDLTPEASNRLGNVLSLAHTDTSRKLLIEGYTDSDGDPTLNQQLSEKRAQSVAQWLIGQGIDQNRISVVGHGSDNAVSANDTPEHKALNRRVVVTLLTANS